MSNIIPFKFNSKPIRAIERDGTPMFIAKDVAELLGYAKPNNAINMHCKGALKQGIVTDNGTYSMVVIPERDVYRLIMRSKMPEAEKFEEWVVGEVLPSIRKTGSYATHKNIPQSFAESLRLAADLADKLEAAQPKIAFAEAVNEAVNSISIRDFAKSIGTGQNKFFELLRDNGYIMSSFKDRNKPYQSFVNQGLFKLQENVRTDQNGERQIWFKTLITAKGQLYFQNKFFNKKAA
jgi:anti-repressor protein